ncbi:hypothetical protein [Paenibacillus sp. IHB B 3084]|uniref:hypothetical protein n=1 Tax=Paenibacillus sp. IHB B 3084 TaxID=867076 RepID=UPI000A75FF4F|nr:hypothetical protein [Paenibacillus sp. IHB B 3084]
MLEQEDCDGVVVIAQATGAVLMVGFIKLAAVHMVDLVRYLFGEVAQVTGFANADEVNTTDRLQVGESHRTPLESLAENDTVLTPSASAMSGGYCDLYLRGFVGEIAHFMNCCQEGRTVP